MYRYPSLYTVHTFHNFQKNNLFIKVGSGLLQIDPAHRWNFSQTFFEKNQNKKVINFQKSNTHLSDFLYFCNMLLSIIKCLVIKLCNVCVWGGGSAYGRVDDGWAIFGPQPDIKGISLKLLQICTSNKF